MHFLLLLIILCLGCSEEAWKPVKTDVQPRTHKGTAIAQKPDRKPLAREGFFGVYVVSDWGKPIPGATVTLIRMMGEHKGQRVSERITDTAGIAWFPTSLMMTGCSLCVRVTPPEGLQNTHSFHSFMDNYVMELVVGEEML